MYGLERIDPRELFFRPRPSPHGDGPARRLGVRGNVAPGRGLPLRLAESLAVDRPRSRLTGRTHSRGPGATARRRAHVHAPARDDDDVGRPDARPGGRLGPRAAQHRQAPDVWTGTKADGTRSTDTCQDWTSTAGTELGHTGDGTGGAGNWTDVGSVTCNTVASLYCFGIDYTTPVDAPSPSGPTRLAFVSRTTFNPSTGLAGADALCAAEAGAGGFAGTFEAVLGTSMNTPDGRFASCGWPWARPDHVIAIQSYDSLRGSPSPWSAPIDQTADGSYLSVPVFVGAPPNTIAFADCADWSTSSSSSNARMGTSGQVDLAMPNSSTPLSPYTPGHVYCLQQ